MNGFTPIDWAIVAAFFAFIACVGALASRGKETASQFFLGARRTPMLAVALSTIATSLSAVTFIGAPADAYAGNLTYVALNIGALLGAALVAAFFVPAFFRAKVSSIYELLGERFGPSTQRAASVMFLIGRTLANGVRLYVAAMFVAVLLFNDLSNARLALAVLVVAAVATAYTAAGGIKAVIWTDCAQVLVVVAAVAASVIILLRQIDLPLGDIIATLRAATASDGSSKLAVMDTRIDPALPYTLASAVVGFTLFNAAAYGTDQDFMQRTLTCRSAWRGSASLMLAIVLGAIVSTAFLIVGLLLFVRDGRAGAATDTPAEVFLRFILNDLPVGVKGLAAAGLLAAALGSLDSALNAMSSSFVHDLVRPARPRMTDAASTRLARVGVLAAAVLVAGFALACIPLRSFTEESILPFALGVMMYAYTGLLAVYAVAIFTTRGNSFSCVAAFAAGAITVAALQFGPPLLEGLAGAQDVQRFSLGWRMAIGFVVALGVCLMGEEPRRA